MLTEREFFIEIKEIVKDNEKLVEYIDNKLIKLESKARARQEERKQKNEENQNLTEKILKILNGTPKGIDEINTALGTTLSPQRVVYLIKDRVNDGTITKSYDEKRKVKYARYGL